MSPNLSWHGCGVALAVGMMAVGFGGQASEAYRHHATGEALLYGLALLALVGLGLGFVLHRKRQGEPAPPGEHVREPISTEPSAGRPWAKGIAWAVLAVGTIAEAFDFLGLAIASGGPHFEGSGLSPAEIAARTQVSHGVGWLFRVLAGVIAADILILWRLYRRGKTV